MRGAFGVAVARQQSHNGLGCSSPLRLEIAVGAAVSIKRGAHDFGHSPGHTVAGNLEECNTLRGNTPDAILNRVATFPVRQADSGGAVASQS